MNISMVTVIWVVIHVDSKEYKQRSSTRTDREVFYSVQEIRATPTLVYVRLTYAVVILIKLSMSVATTELGNVLKQGDIKVSFYLEKLLPHLKAVAVLNDSTLHCLGAKFLEILSKVKVWFQHQGKPHRPVNEEKRSTAGFEPSGRTESKQGGPSQQTDKFSFLTDFSKAPTMNTTTLPNHFQSSNSYPDHNYSLEPAWNDVAFDFPMELDPNLFTHLLQADQIQDYQENEASNVEAFNQTDYFNNVPIYGSWPMQ